MGKLTTAATKGDRRNMLEALRDKIAKSIEQSESGRDIAALSKRLMEVSAEIDTLLPANAPDNPVQAAQKRAQNRGSKKT